VFKGATGGDAFKNGIAGTSTTTNTGATGLDFFTLGAFRRNGTLTGANFWNGRIYGFYLFAQAHTDSDREYIEHLISEQFTVASLEAPENTNPNVLTAWINEYEISSGDNANLNNINLSLIEDII
jgi:hypothetical protein